METPQAQEKRNTTTSALNSPIRLVLSHIGSFITFGYLLATVVGIVYNYFFYQYFGLNILSFSEITDFLVVVIIEPLSILIATGISICVYLLMVLDWYLRRLSPRYKKIITLGLPDHVQHIIDYFIIIMLVIVLSSKTISGLAIHRAKSVSQDPNRTVVVESQGQSKPYQLLATNNRFVFLYDPLAQSTVMFPLESIERITKEKVLTK